MISFEYAASQLAAVWNMAWNRPRWQDMLDRSVDGVFNSFWAVVIAAPFSLLGYFALRRAMAHAPDMPQSPLLQAPIAFGLTINFIDYLVSWGAGLAALIFIARMLGAGGRIADVIIGYNWLHVFSAFLQAAPFAALGLAGGEEIAGALALPSTILVIALAWGYIRRATGAGVPQAISILLFLTILGVVISLVINSIATAVLQAFS